MRFLGQPISIQMLRVEGQSALEFVAIMPKWEASERISDFLVR